MAATLPPSVSRAELLVNGRDDAFRSLLTDLLLFGSALQHAREQIAAAMGVSAPQYAILMAVARFVPGCPSVTEVAAVMRVSVPFIVAQNRGLVAAKLLRKLADPSDRRRVRLVLTPAGRAALMRLAPLQCRINDRLFAGLERAQFASLRESLRILTASLDIKDRDHA